LPARRAARGPDDRHARRRQSRGRHLRGWLLAQMDLAGSSPAFNLARGRCATVAVDSMVFHQPVSVGDEVSIYAAVIRTGRTSIGVRVEAWKRGRGQDAMVRVTEGVFTYVAIDDDRKPRPLPDRD